MSGGSVTFLSPLRVFAIALLAFIGLANPVVGYLGAGTFVLDPAGTTVVDNGGVVCYGATGDGVGGGCLPFPAGGREGGFVKVVDDDAGAAVAFQVCIDNSGDGICGGPQPSDGLCRDQIFFSHDDAGKFFNPLGPLPTSFAPDCGTGAFRGYVVLLCTGVHQPVGAAGPGAPHTHQATRGKILPASDGSGYGDFCGGGGQGGSTGNADAVAKAYRVV